ncbi:MAG TPA: DUF2892 domain-containing protein [Tepidisphaeraceae bacterium]|jgi:uncharacterized membrane protein
MTTRNALKSVKQAVSHVDVDAVTHQAQSGLNRFKNLPQNVNEDEQKYSLIGGAALGAIGLARITHPTGWLLLGAAAALIIRGTTGHCSLYNSLGIDTKNK